MLILNKISKSGYLFLLIISSSLFLAACGDTPTVPPPTPTSPATTTIVVAPATTVRTTVAPVTTTTAAATATTVRTTVAPVTTTTAVPVATTARPATTTTQPATGDIINGKKLFGEVGCSACHGPLAQGDFGPKIAGTKLSYEQVLQQVRNPKGKGPNVMIPFAPEDISDKGVADVYAYLQTLK